MTKEATIYDISEALNLSALTVSGGLRDHPSVKVETCSRIKLTALSIGYQQNTFARNLRKNRSNNIGVILPRLNSSFQSSVVSGIEKRVNQQGYNLIISQSQESVEKEIANTLTMFNSRVVFCNLKQASINIPGDIAVAGFNKVHISRVIDPSLKRSI